MSKFKVGDKVKLIDNDDNRSLVNSGFLKFDEVYSVRDPDRPSYFVYLVGSNCEWASERFELVAEEETKPVEPTTVFKIGSFYRTPYTGLYLYECCGFTSTGLPFFENPDGSPVAVGDDTRSKLVEYVKPIEVGSRVYSNVSDREFIVTAIHDGYAWVHTEGSKGGSIQNLSNLKRLG